MKTGWGASSRRPWSRVVIVVAVVVAAIASKSDAAAYSIDEGDFHATLPPGDPVCVLMPAGNDEGCTEQDFATRSALQAQGRAGSIRTLNVHLPASAGPPATSFVTVEVSHPVDAEHKEMLEADLQQFMLGLARGMEKSGQGKIETVKRAVIARGPDGAQRATATYDLPVVRPGLMMRFRVLVVDARDGLYIVSISGFRENAVHVDRVADAFFGSVRAPAAPPNPERLGYELGRATAKFVFYGVGGVVVAFAIAYALRRKPRSQVGPAGQSTGGPPGYGPTYGPPPSYGPPPGHGPPPEGSPPSGGSPPSLGPRS